mgnify:CR=1 FL=1
MITPSKALQTRPKQWDVEVLSQYLLQHGARWRSEKAYLKRIGTDPFILGTISIAEVRWLAGTFMLSKALHGTATRAVSLPVDAGRIASDALSHGAHIVQESIFSKNTRAALSRDNDLGRPY